MKNAAVVAENMLWVWNVVYVVANVPVCWRCVVKSRDEFDDDDWSGRWLQMLL